MGMTQAQQRLIDAAERRRAAEAFAREYAAWRAEQRTASNLDEDERNWQPLPPGAVVGLAIGAIVLGCTLPAAIVWAVIRLVGGMT